MNLLDGQVAADELLSPVSFLLLGHMLPLLHVATWVFMNAVRTGGREKSTRALRSAVADVLARLRLVH